MLPIRLRDTREYFVVTTICLVVIFSAISIAFTSTQNDTALRLYVRSADGESVYSTLSLGTGAVTPASGGGALPMKTTRVPIAGGVLVLEKSGIVERSQNGEVSVRIASPVPPTTRTVFAVWGDGARVAWVSPADLSLQVFERSKNGSYTPLYVSAIRANSLAFSDSGDEVVVAVFGIDATAISSIRLSDGATRTVSTVPGFATILPQQ